MYQGPAAVVLPDGSGFAVTAFLESGGAPGVEVWRGTVVAHDPGPLWDTLVAGRAVLRLPSQWEGVFASPRLEGADGLTLRVIGYGPAPF
jgi:hypothetical protein